MKRILFVFMGLAFLSISCARVRVEAPKEPIKVDITMRLDIYQHVTKDIDAIENLVTGSQEKPKKEDIKSKLNFFLSNVYAQEGLGPEVEQSALRRKERRVELIDWQAKGIVGENKSALVEIRKTEGTNSSLEKLVNAENADRMLIYEAVAQKNGTPVGEVQKLYAKRLQADAPVGAPIELFNAASGTYKWEIKN